MYACCILQSRWGKPYKGRRDWKACNEELVIRGTFLFDLDFADQWDSELKRMNLGRIYIPLPGMKFM
ncbi:MAG: IS5/IS1182 family transposase, partial [Conexivisphaerales archaeon]